MFKFKFINDKLLMIHIYNKKKEKITQITM